MKPFQITLINGITLIIVGTWGYFSSANPSLTAFIPVISGIILLLLVKGVRNANKVVAHIAVILTLIILIALIKPLSGGFERKDHASIFRVIIMMITCTLALILYIKSFVDARRLRS